MERMARRAEVTGKEERDRELVPRLAARDEWLAARDVSLTSQVEHVAERHTAAPVASIQALMAESRRRAAAARVAKEAAAATAAAMEMSLRMAREEATADCEFGCDQGLVRRMGYRPVRCQYCNGGKAIDALADVGAGAGEYFSATTGLEEQVHEDLSAAWAAQAAAHVIDRLVRAAAQLGNANLETMAGGILEMVVVVAMSRGQHNVERREEEERVAALERERQAAAFLVEFEAAEAARLEQEEKNRVAAAIAARAAQRATELRAELEQLTVPQLRERAKTDNVDRNAVRRAQEVSAIEVGLPPHAPTAARARR
jgi:hypothetical protein